jgi:phage tail sheath protein FI
MATNYLHGVETVTVNSGVVPVTVIKTAVVGLIGVAPKGPVNELTLVTSSRDAAQFGASIPGATIPQALAAIFAQGPATVIVINVRNADNLSAVTGEVLTVENGKFRTEGAPIGELVVSNAAGSVTYVSGVDYKFDGFGNVEVTSAAISEGDSVHVSYTTLDPQSTGIAQLIGGIDANEDRTGLELFDLALNEFGFNPKVLIAPEFSGVPAVKAALLVKAAKYRAVALIDSEPSFTPTEAIADRGPAGSAFNTSDMRAVLLYPRIKMFDAYSDSDVTAPYSSFLAGIICATDYNEGYHVSPSNHEIKGQTGVQRKLTAAVNDPDSQVNLLNSAGIVTVFNAYGTGLRVWGNRNASFPSKSDPTTFVPVLRTSDVVAESIEQASLQFADRPINLAVIDSIKETVNEFLRTLQGRGALIDGKCTFDRSKNSNADIAAGRLVFDYSLMPPPPLERLTFNHFIDISLLKTLK